MAIGARWRCPEELVVELLSSLECHVETVDSLVRGRGTAGDTELLWPAILRCLRGAMVGFSNLVFGDKGRMPLTRFKDLHLGVLKSFSALAQRGAG